MSDAERQTRSHLIKLFQRHGINPRTDLGQNFLIDINIIDFIVREARLTKDDLVLEIGAGTGGMTAFLGLQAGHVISVEVDQNMHMLASEATASFDNVTLLREDALRNKNNMSDLVLAKIREHLAEHPERRLKLIANLPYNVATPVISNLVATDIPWSRMVVTIQLELGQRMAAKPGRNHYGALTAWLQSQCSVKILKRLPPTVFWPRPKVNSAIVRLSPIAHLKDKIKDRPFYHDFVRRLFHQRRKYMRSVLVGMYRKQLTKQQVDAVLAEFEFKESVRAEELEVFQLVKIANRLWATIRALETGLPIETEPIAETKLTESEPPVESGLSEIATTPPEVKTGTNTTESSHDESHATENPPPVDDE